MHNSSQTNKPTWKIVHSLNSFGLSNSSSCCVAVHVHNERTFDRIFNFYAIFPWHSHSLLACSHLRCKMCVCLFFFARRCRCVDRVEMKNWRILLKKYAKKILRKKLDRAILKEREWICVRVCSSVCVVVWVCDSCASHLPICVFNFIGKWGCLFINTLCTI